MSAATADKLAGLLDDVAPGALRLTVEATVPLERVPVVVSTHDGRGLQVGHRGWD